MSLKCLFGVHRPSLASIGRKGRGYVAYCDACARPLERSEGGRWEPSAPLDKASTRSVLP
ncbi:MAG TPA: hypothetical protein VGB54_07400 [Allosphingosinicella sp.]|jgi:hypothetical protein